MSLQGVWQKCLSFFTDKPIVIETSSRLLTSDAGLLPIREFDEQLGLTAGFAAALHDPRDGAVHTFAEMTRSRIYGILAGYEDQNDHDQLRCDAVFKLIAGRSPDGDNLASQPTLSRFENQISIPSLRRLQDVFIDQFIASFATPPLHLTFDIDPFDDPAHGQQQLVLFHGHYDQHQYLPRLITCAENKLVVMLCLLHGTAHASMGAEDDIEYLVNRLRAVWRDVQIYFRGDSGFGVPRLYNICEKLRILYSFGGNVHKALQRQTEHVLEAARAAYAATGEPQRLFQAFEYRARGWPQPRWTIVKVEVNARGVNRRAVITNRPGARVLPGATYDAYAERGESENRNKEVKQELSAGRLSDHRYMANLFRLYLHCAAYNLLARLRNHVADSPASAPPSLHIPPPPAQLPTAALDEPQRRRYFNHRRECDPLGGGHACTWRMRLIKVAAEIIVSARRVVVRLSGSWPHLEHYAAVCDAVSSRQELTPAETG